MVAEEQMTRDAFEKNYAKRSSMTVEALYALGLRAEFCECGEDGCPGWKMMSKK